MYYLKADDDKLKMYIIHPKTVTKKNKNRVKSNKLTKERKCSHKKMYSIQKKREKEEKQRTDVIGRDKQQDRFKPNQ